MNNTLNRMWRTPVAGKCIDIDGATWHVPGEKCEDCGWGIPDPSKVATDADIVERLRDQAAQVHDGAAWCLENKAADEIERLQVRIEKLEFEVSDLHCKCGPLVIHQPMPKGDDRA